MDKVAQISDVFTKAGAELAVLLAERIKARDAATYERLKAGVGDGMHLVISVVTAVMDPPEIRLEIVDHEGTRLTLASIAGKMTLNA